MVALAAPGSAAAAPIACDPIALIQAVDGANSNGPGLDVIELAPGCIYTFTASNQVGDMDPSRFEWAGPSAVPAIASQIEIVGNGAVIERAPDAPNFRIFYVGADPADPDTPEFCSPGAGTLLMSDLTVRGGRAVGDFYGAGEPMGGAIFNEGRVELDGVTLSGNSAVAETSSGACGVTDFGNGQIGMGGAIFNNHGEVELVNSTLSGNTTSGSGSEPNGLGGAVFNVNGRVDTHASTLAANSADAGGALYNLGYAFQAFEAEAILRSSILADTIGGSDLVSDVPALFQGSAPNGASSLVDVSTFDLVESSQTLGAGAVTGSPLSADPGLGPLLSNGGPTNTQELLPGSPAIDAGARFGLAVDQRGVARPQNHVGTPNAADGSDIGAYELESTTGINFGPGDDVPGRGEPLRGACKGLNATILGTPGDDELIGTSAIDVIDARGGDDVIRGLGDADLICGGGGEDVLRGGSGDDFVIGRAKDDDLLGGPGDDIMNAGSGGDAMNGGRGDDFCAASFGNDPEPKRCESVTGVP
jgi:hypothetical protein